MALALLSFVFYGLSDLFYKRAQVVGARPVTFMLVQGGTATILILAASAVTGSLRYDGLTLFYGALAGLVGFGWNVLLMRSLRHGDASVNVPLFKLSFLLTAFAAILLLGEPLTLGKVLALGLAVFAVLMFASLFSTGRSALQRESLPSLVGAVVLNAISALVLKLAVSNGVSALTFLPYQAVCYMVVGVAFALATGTIRHGGGAGVRFAPICGILLAPAVLFLVMSLETGDASVSVPTVQMSFLLTSALAMLTLGEPLSRRKLGGIGLAALAVLVFAFGR